MDFTNLPIRKKSYGGANGNKLSIMINNQLYMLKLPSHAPKNINLSYANSCVSEYIGCHIFNMLGMKAIRFKVIRKTVIFFEKRR